MKCFSLPAIIAGAVGLFLIWLPMSLQAQLVLSLTILGIMLALMIRPDIKTFRQIIFVCATVLAMRYAFWRTTQTLPDISEPINFIPGFILYIAEMFSLLMMAVSFFIVADPLKRARPAILADAECPTVDVFVPSYNEDPELLALTLAAARSMNYPQDKLTVYLLDDGGTDAKCSHKDPRVAVQAMKRREQLKALCAALGVKYHARRENSHAKAGNLNAGLEVSTGELVVVFDADHAPVREFLHETVGYFTADEKLFLVQTPHMFLNPDPLEKNLETFARMPSENEMFYSVVQCGLDKWDASFFCGSAAVLRRTALKETDGFSGQSITEDCETALSLHSRGWHSVYVDRPLIAGLQPETFVSFIGQRARWCQGMLQILILNRPFLARGLTMGQRICYAGTNLFWLFPVTRLIFMFAPLLYIFFSLEIFQANILEFACYTAMYLVSSFAMQSYLYGRVRWPWVSELYEYVQSVMLLGSIISVIRNPRKPTFNVTAKGQTLEESRLSPLARPYFVIFAVLLGSGLYAIWRYLTEPMSSELLLIVAGWNFINVGIAAAALGVVSERRERRRNHRLQVRRHALMRIAGKLYSILIEDASSGGIAVQFMEGDPGLDKVDGAVGTVELRRAGIARSFQVVHRSISDRDDGKSFGFAYAERTPETFLAIADLMFSEQSTLQDRLTRRQKRQGYLQASLAFFVWVFAGMLRFFQYTGGLVSEQKEKSFDDAPMMIDMTSDGGEVRENQPDMSALMGERTYA
ncbi:UDP-forming cellulose synthase catalytic subunit [Allorhizobium taibaishanense]|uniref:Cellulose synthase catalytic subunit [UDP-forming] n=1 Tax=Allorhizobium taibaishanense TaxID=887144 RepID=A0A1Q9A9K1_9HYPH|nr:UDP-forming cellulose synthase catalytic subunit [Allorhizobium taibaishanense]MBB4009882.1 cellulose synthase (UDP-forming) [Allorhizobium taibaishanense]OLP51512.1 cellulose synthase catalytic subunit (UDP-forming) [Allorhizobium taibaishanense]